MLLTSGSVEPYGIQRHNVYEIDNVIGPDEWHEHVNNNAFTNYMARWNIQIAIDALHWLQSIAPDKAKELIQQLDLNEQAPGPLA